VNAKKLQHWCSAATSREFAEIGAVELDAQSSVRRSGALERS
jgi:hypothetical protein